MCYSGNSFRCSVLSSDVYHLTFLWPESAEVAQRLERPDGPMAETEIASRLHAYHREVQGLQDTYRNCLKIINADQPHEDVFAQGENTFSFSSGSFLYACLVGIALTETGEFISVVPLGTLRYYSVNRIKSCYSE